MFQKTNVWLAGLGRFVLWYKKGYQDTCDVESTVVTKVKGVTYTNYSDQDLNVTRNPELYRRIWDQSDYVVPASSNERGGFFVMTTVVITPNQTRGICPEVRGTRRLPIRLTCSFVRLRIRPLRRQFVSLTKTVTQNKRKK